MKKLILISLSLLLASAVSVCAQSNAASAQPDATQGKGGTYLAPAGSVQKTQTVTTLQNSGTGSVNPTASQDGLPADFPRLANTGNPEKDQADYARAKAEWIKNNPERYKAMQQQPANSDQK